MKGPYENNKVYAIAAVGSTLKKGYVSAVFAQVRYSYTGRVSDDVSEGRFFPAHPEDNDGTGGVWDPTVPEGALLSLSEDEGPFEVPASAVLSLWDDRDEAWAQYEARRTSGRKGRQTRIEREQQAKREEIEARNAVLAERRTAREQTPLGQLEKTPGVDSIMRLIPRRNRPEQLHLDLILDASIFRKVMELLNADPAQLDAFLAAEPPSDEEAIAEILAR